MVRTSWIAASAFAVTAVVTGAGVTFAQRSAVGPPAWAGDLTTAQFVEVRSRSGEVLLHGALTTTKDTPKETEREADLTNPAGQTGSGDVEIQIERSKDGAQTENAIEVEVEKLPALLDCEVFLDRRSIGTLVTSKKGKAELKLEWKTTPGR